MVGGIGIWHLSWTSTFGRGESPLEQLCDFADGTGGMQSVGFVDLMWRLQNGEVAIGREWRRL